VVRDTRVVRVTSTAFIASLALSKKEIKSSEGESNWEIKFCHYYCTMAQYPPINVRLAVNRVDFNLISNDGIQPRLYTPGEEISNQPDFLR